MRKELKDRVIAEAEYIVVYHTTIEKAAEHFGVGTSTVHYDVTQRLPQLDKKLFRKVRGVLDYNLSQRATRGGRASREKKKESQKK